MTKQTAEGKKQHGGSTQRFTEIHDIQGSVVLFNGGYASMVVEVQASNFALLSQAEQNAKIYAYAALINSLSFPIQIVIRNKKIDISSYLNLLDQQVGRTAGESDSGIGFSAYIKLYRDFIQELVTVNSVLDKKFYIVIPYSYLEKGAAGAAAMVKKSTGGSEFIESAKTSLQSKADSLISQIARLSLRAKILEKEELVKLFYDMYNSDQSTSDALASNVHVPIIEGGAK